MNIRRLLYSEYSDVIISIILGFGLATMFRKICNERNCIVFHAPKNEDIETQILTIENFIKECKLEKKSKSIDLALHNIYQIIVLFKIELITASKILPTN